MISEYIFNVMTAVGSATTCKEVVNNPEGAKQSVLDVIEAINRLSPTNKIETSSAVSKFDAVLIYCKNNPNDLLLNALLKTSTKEVSQDFRTENSGSLPSLEGNHTNVPANNNKPSSSKGTIHGNRKEIGSSGDDNNKIEFIN